MRPGSVPEWPKGTGCKPVGLCLRWFKSNSAHQRRRAPPLGRGSSRWWAESCGAIWGGGFGPRRSRTSCLRLAPWLTTPYLSAQVPPSSAPSRSGSLACGESWRWLRTPNAAAPRSGGRAGRCLAGPSGGGMPSTQVWGGGSWRSVPPFAGTEPGDAILHRGVGGGEAGGEAGLLPGEGVGDVGAGLDRVDGAGDQLRCPGRASRGPGRAARRRRGAWRRGGPPRTPGCG